VYLGEKSKEDSEIRKTNELKDVATDIFRNKVFISNQNLYKAIMESMDVKERTARSYIKFMRDKGIIEKNPNNSLEYSLISMPF
jgi:predicted transcriptional regulator